MSLTRRILALLIIFFFITGVYSGLLTPALAASALVNATVDSYAQGELKIRWNSVPGTRAIIIEYHEPDVNNKGVIRSQTLVQSTNTATVSGLKNNYIYDISIKIYDNTSGTGRPIGQGLFYFIPAMTFSSDQVEQGFTAISGGGRETGDKPKLRLKWAVPKVYEGVTGDFIDADKPEALTHIQDMLNDTYGYGTQISTLNYRINISTDFSKLNGGSAQSSVLVNYLKSEYRANVSGKDDIAVDVNRVSQNLQDFMVFDVIGKSSYDALLPNPEQYGLPHNDILPGTVYYMNIKPVFKNSQGTQIGGITLGAPADQNSSKLSGEFAYTYTPIRFQITRDYANNAYVKIYKVNHGSLDLPRLYYQVQTSDDPTVQGDWIVKKTMDDTYFNGDFALTIISDINPYNELYYKIVVKTDSSNDRLESSSMPYTLYEDKGRPPTPTGVLVEKREQTVTTKEGKTLKSTDVTISWSKPLNWNDIKNNDDSGEDIVYHILLNTAQTELNIQPNPPLIAEGIDYGSFPVKYRLVKYISSKELIENGNRLEYTIKGFELFKGRYFNGSYDANGKPQFEEEEITNTERYPDFLLPNKVYYFQVYTTKGINKGSVKSEHMSEKSLTTSFTTLARDEKEVPLIKNLKVNANSADIQIDPVTGNVEHISNYIELQFERPDINWRNYTSDIAGNNRDYYDLYVSTRPEADSFILIGSTHPTVDTGDIEWDNRTQNTIISAKIRSFSAGTPAYSAFGAELRPNTTYYFMIRTRLSIDRPANELISVPAILLPVTTIKGPVEEPDHAGRRPLAPTDFSVAQDENENFLISGTSVTFRWPKLEKDIEYRLICTSERVMPDADESSWTNDPLYRHVSLNPLKDLTKGYFEYIEAKNEYRFTMNEGLFPNRIYYFSLKAIKTSDKSESYWVSIPVTTTLIDSPVSLEAINDYQIGFFWQDSNVYTGTENFKVYIKSFMDYSYKLLNKTQYTIIKDGKFYYGRVRNLEPNTSYSVRVYKGQGETTPVFEKDGLSTRDEYHQIEVRWKGLKGYKYELAIKSEDQDDYITLNDSDLMEYTGVNGGRLPYYIEGIENKFNSDYDYYYARIRRVGITLPNGQMSSLPLKSNTKYYVKVRAIKTDSMNLEAVAKSRYEGPVTTRTEYNQEDYDKDTRQDEYKETFLEKVKDLEKNYYWEVLGSNSGENSILLKEDRVVNGIQNSLNLSYDIDITRNSTDIGVDIIYIPLGVLKEMNLSNKLLNIKVSGAEYSFKPRSIDIDSSNGINQLMSRVGIKDVLAKITITGISGQAYALPYNTQLASKTSSLKVQALGITKNQKEIKELVYNKLYNKDTGLVYQTLDSLLQAIRGIGPEAERFLDEYIAALARIIEHELSIYIGSTLELIKPNSFYQEVSTFDSKVSIKLYHSGREESVVPYASYNSGGSWVEIPGYTNNPGYILFETVKTGNFIALKAKSKSDNVAENVALEKKWKNLGLDDVTSFSRISGSVTRQELAGILMEFFSVKLGIDMSSYRPGKIICITDEDEVDNKYYKSVVMSIEYDIMTLKEGKKFDPRSKVENHELAKALDKLIELLE